MKKIVSLFQRNYDGDHLVRDEVVPGAEWVATGEGIATVKWDGTAVLVKDGRLYRRYDAKNGKTPPPDFLPAQESPDPITGHWPGWLLVLSTDPSNKWLIAAYADIVSLPDWTYEFIGPHVQGNPYRLPSDCFIRHGEAWLPEWTPRDFAGLCRFLSDSSAIEGIVWWRDLADIDCDKVKIKRRDFGLPWPRKSPDGAPDGR